MPEGALEQDVRPVVRVLHWMAMDYRSLRNEFEADLDHQDSVLIEKKQRQAAAASAGGKILFVYMLDTFIHF